MGAAAKSASTEQPVHYERHRPERTLLYQLVQEYYPACKAHLEAQGTSLPRYVEREFEDYLKCGRLEGGFLRVQCENCHAERLVAYSCCPQWETIKSPESGVRYLWHLPKDSLPIVSGRKARR